MIKFKNQEVQNNIISKFYEKNIIPNMLLIGDDELDKENFIIHFIKNYYNNNPIYLDSEILYLNIIIDRSIKKIREIIKKFINQTSYYDNEKNIILKFIIIHNIENINFEIQYALRRIIEDNNKKIRFILIGNNSQTIIQPLISRCLLIYFNNLSSTIKYDYLNNCKKNKFDNIVKLYSIRFLDNNLDIIKQNDEIDWNYLFDFKDINDFYKNIQIICNKNISIYLILDNFTDWIIKNENINIHCKFKIFKMLNSQTNKLINNTNIFLNLFHIFLYYLKIIKSNH